MQIQSIGNMSALGGLSGSTEKKAGSTSFADILNEAMDNVKDTQESNEANTLALLSGDDTGIHTSMLETQKAELALNLAVQIRNKVIDAYNEVMRMQL